MKEKANPATVLAKGKVKTKAHQPKARVREKVAVLAAVPERFSVSRELTVCRGTCSLELWPPYYLQRGDGRFVVTSPEEGVRRRCQF